MAQATGQPTVMQWIKHLLGEIDKQTRYAEPFERRYANEHILPFLAKEYAEVYPGIVIASADGRTVDSVITGSMLSMLDVPKTGTAAVVVDALVERLILSGIACPGNAEATKLLQAAWEDNDLDVMHQEGTRESLIGARAFVSIAREVNGPRAVVGIEHASQAAVHRMATAPYDVDAYLKIWRDEWTGNRAGLLRLPGLDYSLTEGDIERPDPDGSDVSSRWTWGEPEKTGLGGVPVVELAPRSRLLKEPTSEIDRITTAIDILDLIEGLMVFAGHFGAVPIRYGKGLDIPRDPKDPTKPLLGEDGKPMLGFKPRADHFWGSTSKDADFGQLEPAGLDSFVTWADHAAGVVRRQTKLPSSYFSLDLKSHMSGELLKVDEAPMVRRVGSMGEHGPLNQSWRRAGQWILEIEDPALAKQARVKPQWIDPETRIESQQIDGFQKVVASGLGVKASAQQLLGWPPDVIAAAVAEGQAARDAESGIDPDFERITRGFLDASGIGA